MPQSPDAIFNVVNVSTDYASVSTAPGVQRTPSR